MARDKRVAEGEATGELVVQVPAKLRKWLSEIVKITDRFCDSRQPRPVAAAGIRRGEERNPLVWMVEVDGLPYDIRLAPRHVQEEACRRGIIPFVPDGGEEGGGGDA